MNSLQDFEQNYFIVYQYIYFQTDVPTYSQGIFLKHSEATLKMLMLVSNGHRNKEYLSELLLSNMFILLGFVLHLAILVEVNQCVSCR